MRRDRNRLAVRTALRRGKLSQTVSGAGWALIAMASLVVGACSGGSTPSTNEKTTITFAQFESSGDDLKAQYAAMIADGSWSADKIAGELGDVLLNKIPARGKENETIVFESVGMSLWDTTATAWAYHWALATGIGMQFSLE